MAVDTDFVSELWWGGNMRRSCKDYVAESGTGREAWEETKLIRNSRKKRRSKVGEDEWENLFWESSINQCNHTHEIYDTKRRLVSSENENIDLKIKLHFLCGELKAPTLRFQNVGWLSSSRKKIISYLFGAAAYKRYIILYILFFSALLFLLGRSTS